MRRILFAIFGLMSIGSGRALAEDVNFDLNYTLGVETLKVSGTLHQTSITRVDPTHVRVNYDLTSGSLSTAPSAGFSAAAVTVLRNANYSATMDVQNGTNTLNITVKTNSPSTDPYEPPTTFTVTQVGTDGTWGKDEGVIKTSSSGNPNCTQIEPTGNQPRSGVLSVILTKPASCDFKLPSVKIGDFAGQFVDVPIGSYWHYSSLSSSHSFPILPTPVKDSTGSPLYIDDGFLLVQPDHKSYLLADAGNAIGGTTAQQIAEQISQSQGWGSTTLTQPNPGSPSDNYATATVFKAGSVIAIFDDTPDMSGQIQVSALIDSAIELGLSLDWNAEIAP